MRAIWAAIAAIVLSTGIVAGGGETGHGTAGATPVAAVDRAPRADRAAPAAGATPAPSPSPSSCGGAVRTVQEAEKLITEATGCAGAVNTFWHGELGNAWTPPTFVPYHNGEVPADACGKQGTPDQFADNALYCTLDDTVAYSVDFLDELAGVGGPSFPLFVLMHELAHRGDRIAGSLGVVNRAEENQADCFAGRQTAAARDAGRIEMSDALHGSLLFFSLGDTRGGWYDQEPATAPDAHGTPLQRAQAFSLGFLQGSDTCHRIGKSRSGDVAF